VKDFEGACHQNSSVIPACCPITQKNEWGWSQIFLRRRINKTRQIVHTNAKRLVLALNFYSSTIPRNNDKKVETTYQVLW
jgi:hypothetical protein